MNYKDIIEEINLEKLPTHVAIIMDGNGRWAKQKGIPRLEGHREGVRSVKAIIKVCVEMKIEYLTLYAFSTENWRRPKSEVAGLFRLLLEALAEEIDELCENNVKLQFIGSKKNFTHSFYNKVISSSSTTWNCTGLNVNIALNYGGREEILQAVNNLNDDIKKGKLKGKITEKRLQKYLYTSHIPDPDLIIRTSGEIRLSNFLLWQSAYSELYFTDIYWPAFRKAEFCNAILDFQQRKRRFGKSE